MDFTPTANPHGNDRATAQAAGMRNLWGGAITDRSGFVAVPVSLLKLQPRLGLSPIDMMVLINLLAHRWSRATGVFPRNSIIAKRLGVTDRTVQRSTQKLVEAGLVRRDRDREGRRVFYFEPLVEKLTKLTPLVEWQGEIPNDV